MVTPTRKCGSVFYPSPSIFYEGHNMECPLTKYEQFVVLKNFQSSLKIYEINDK